MEVAFEHLWINTKEVLTHSTEQIYEYLCNNQINARALIGQSAMVYCVCFTNIPRGLSDPARALIGQKPMFYFIVLRVLSLYHKANEEA